VFVEDQTMFLQLLVGMLRTIPGIHLAAVAQGVREAVQTCRSLPVDLLVLDLALPDGDGLDVLRRRGAADAGPQPGAVDPRTLLRPRVFEVFEPIR
jgi:response regulator of citrate/malate metabolism